MRGSVFFSLFHSVQLSCVPFYMNGENRCPKLILFPPSPSFSWRKAFIVLIPFYRIKTSEITIEDQQGQIRALGNTGSSKTSSAIG